MSANPAVRANLTDVPATQKAGEHFPRSLRILALPLGLILLFLAFVVFPSILSNRRLVITFVAVGLVLVFWWGLILACSIRTGRRLSVELIAIKSHYVQAAVQFCVYAYFGWYWRNVYHESPLILAQIVFLYVFDMLLCWSRRERYRLGFGPFPIILSTNLFMWFRDNWFIFQFLMVATGALGKEFIHWKRDGKAAHIFNPSALSLSLFSLVLILTGTTQYTWGQELATMLGAPPYIYVQIFLVGLVVQFFFSVTLMTLSAAAMLCLLNVIYTGTMGTYHFIDSNIPIAVFLGLHLLMTDPSTSPRTNLGRVIFGGGYGLGVFVTYALLAHFGTPRFYDKLLVVPLLNLSVRAIDRFVRSGITDRFTRWEATIKPRSLNVAHMTCWVALFSIMLGTGFVQARHPGESIAFWKEACEEKRPYAVRNLVTILDYYAGKGSGEACNELGLLYAEGRFAPRDPAKAAYYFAKGCELGNLDSSANVALQYLFYGQSLSPDGLARAFDLLEANTTGTNAAQRCYLLGVAYETGRGRVANKARARDLYGSSCELGEMGACKNLGRMRLYGEGGAVDAVGAAKALEKACQLGDAQSCFILAPMYHSGQGVPKDEEQAISCLKRACELGMPDACVAVKKLAK